MSSQVFHENVVVITGASSGIGRELALQLADQGAWLALAARRAEDLQDVAQACIEKGAKAIAVATDVVEETQCRALIDRVLQEYGRIDTLINNAGISMWTSFEDAEDLEGMKRIMEVNYYGSVYCTRYALPELKKTKGRLVGIASLTGVTGVPTRTFYAASKHAMMGFFDSLRIELMDTGVSVTMICPGFVSTEITRLDAGGGMADNDLVKENKTMPVATCCRIIIDRAARRKREEIMTWRGKLGRWLKLVAPGAIDKIARKVIEEGG
ncbi:MAG: SDR family oxidoreductase [Acidobacteriota bacterium]|nr:SDR family oxidoreductase [Acidobacteriota bacterium]